MPRRIRIVSDGVARSNNTKVLLYPGGKTWEETGEEFDLTPFIRCLSWKIGERTQPDGYTQVDVQLIAPFLETDVTLEVEDLPVTGGEQGIGPSIRRVKAA